MAPQSRTVSPLRHVKTSWALWDRIKCARWMNFCRGHIENTEEQEEDKVSRGTKCKVN